jgi:hypothetical protein
VTAFAATDDLLALFETEPTGARKLNRLDALLEIAADELRGELGQGREFLRNPTEGERTWLADGDGGNLLHVHAGIVSLSLVEISIDYGLTFFALAETDWTLQWDAYSSDEPPAGEPSFHVRIRPYSSYPVFPRGKATVRLTGATGYPAVPPALIEGNAERARQLAFADGSYEGNVASDDGYGRPTVTNRWPDVTWKFIKRESDRFYACDL